MNFIELEEEHLGSLDLSVNHIKDEIYQFAFYDSYWYIEALVVKNNRRFDQIVSYKVEYDSVPINGNELERILINILDYCNFNY
jgi:hypothetical protein